MCLVAQCWPSSLEKRCESEYIQNRKGMQTAVIRFAQAQPPAWPKSRAQLPRPLQLRAAAQRAPKNAPQAYQRLARWPGSQYAPYQQPSPPRSCAPTLAPRHTPAIDARTPIPAPQHAPEPPVGTPQQSRTTLQRSSSCSCCPDPHILATEHTPLRTSLLVPALAALAASPVQPPQHASTRAAHTMVAMDASRQCHVAWSVRSDQREG